jgi:hypothetical protein
MLTLLQAPACSRELQVDLLAAMEHMMRLTPRTRELWASLQAFTSILAVISRCARCCPPFVQP